MFSPKAIINLDNLAHNYRLIKDQLNNIPIMAVVKANAYGHGVIEISKALRNEGVKFFAVFTFNEALELRDAGITENILVFCRPTKQMLEIAYEKDITFCFYTINFYYSHIRFNRIQKNSAIDGSPKLI